MSAKSKGGRVITMLRTAVGLVPRAEQDWEQLNKIRIGSQCSVEIRVQRNPRFHNMVLSLLRFAYEMWEDAPEAHKNFEKFREEITIKAGYSETYYSLLSRKIHVKARSIAFGSMSEQEFEAYFEAIKKTVWEMVAERSGRYTPDEFDRIVNELVRYDG